MHDRLMGLFLDAEERGEKGKWYGRKKMAG